VQDTSRSSPARARGIAAEIAVRLSRDGHRVVVCDIDLEGAQRTAEGLGRDAIAVGADVSDSAAVARMAATVTAQLGEPDVLVNNAGVI
jgi:3-oxoacyl-[acyl-carrier protein] reductase